MLTVNERVIHIRKVNGDSQKDLAEYLHISNQALCKWEKGKINVPSWAIKMICERYHVSADYMLGIGK